jgi:hypothetical protein
MTEPTGIPSRVASSLAHAGEVDRRDDVAVVTRQVRDGAVDLARQRGQHGITGHAVVGWVDLLGEEPGALAC